MRSVHQDAATYAFLTEQDESTGNTFGHNLFAPGNRLNDAVVQNYFRWVLKLAPVLQESVFTIPNKANQTVAELIQAGDNATAKASYSVLSFNQSEDEASHIVPGPPPQRDSDLLKQRHRKRVSDSRVQYDNFMSESHSNNRYAFGGNGDFTQGGSGKLPPLAKKPVAIKGRQSQGVNQEGTEPDHEASTFR